MASTPKVAVVIRTLNESELLGTCLETLEAQRPAVPLELVVVDSGSTDATLEIARCHTERIVEIAPGEFDYGTALNVGFERVVESEIVIVLSAHAVPVDETWLATMLSSFDDPAVAAVASRQVPWPEASWKEVDRLGKQFDDARRVFSTADADAVLFSNAASAVRLSTWREHRFIRTWAAEDVEWARRVLSHGWKVIYEPRATVYHSHDETPRAQAQRWIDINRAHDGERRRGVVRRVRDAGGLVYRDTRSILALDVSVRCKSRYVRDVVSTGFHYTAHFNRAGSTAERRQEVVDRSASPFQSGD